MLIVNAEIDDRPRMTVRFERGRITAVGPAEAASRRGVGEEVIDAAGGMVIPGLHDHHIHLLALAAAAGSVACGPPAVRTPEQLVTTLREAAARVRAGGRPLGGAAPAWVRGVGYHESVAGTLDRFRLDAIVGDVPVRVQHRSGAMWMLNSRALAVVGLVPTPGWSDAGRPGVGQPGIGQPGIGQPEARQPGVGCDAGGAPDGRLHRMDSWLRARLGPAPAPDLAAVGRQLAGFGVTGVTDATVSTGPSEAALLTAAAQSGDMPQRLVLTGGADLAFDEHRRVRLGPVKLVLDESVPVGLDAVAGAIGAARAAGRQVAVHCVTRSDLVLALAAFTDAGGSWAGDRVEHAAVVPPELVEPLAEAGLTVVTQPHFIAERGDQYLSDVDPDDVGWLYRCAGLRRAGIPVAAGTDAPFGGADPWASMRAAVSRRTAAGRPLGPSEAVEPRAALGMYLGDPLRPGGPPRRVVQGAPADLCLLAVPARVAFAELDVSLVAVTVADGKVVADLR